MAVLNQEIKLFEDDTLDLEFTINSFDESNDGTSYLSAVWSTDMFWWGVSTSPPTIPIGISNSLILEKTTPNWFSGIFGYSNILIEDVTQNTTNASPIFTWYYDYQPQTSGNGTGLFIDLFVDGSGKVNTINTSTPLPSNIPQSGQNFAPGDTITIPTSLIGGSTDVIITLSPNSLLQPAFPSTSGGITMETGNYYDTSFPPTDSTFNPATIKISLTQDDFAASSGPLETNTTYYWQLVWSRIWNLTVPAQVVANGTLIVEPSQFSEGGYRP